MKKTSKLLGTFLTAALALAALAVPAYADPLYVESDTENGSLTVNKYLVMDKGVAAAPKETFEFNMTSVTNTTGMTDAGIPVKPGETFTNTNASIEFTAASALTDGSETSDSAGITTQGTDEKYATGTATISLEDAQFTSAGIYRYELRENTGIQSYITYDQSAFYVDFVVGFKDDAAEENGTLSILGVKTFRHTDKNGTTVDEAVKAENKLVNLYSTADLNITKTVTGNMGERNREFTFTVTIASMDALEGGSALTVVKTDAEGITSPVTGWTVGAGNTINLKHGEKVTVKGLPAGTEYTVAETDYAADGYTTSCVSTIGTYTSGPTTEGNTVNGRVDKDGNTEAFTNARNVATPTGILLEVWPYALVVLLAVAAAVLMLTKKSKKSRR